MFRCIKPHIKTIFWTSLTLIAFAANSLLSRLALEQLLIDPASFSLIRLTAGAIALSFILFTTNRNNLTNTSQSLEGNWFSAWMLFLYVVSFTFAYLSLNTGVGALILFGTVQTTMLMMAIVLGERPTFVEWVGILIALLGLVFLLLPGLTSPPLLASILMIIAGIAWGAYSLLGGKNVSPLGATAGNFIRAVPLSLIIFLILFQQTHYSIRGVLLAIISGAIASGVGYAMWYKVLQKISTTRAAVIQLMVPVIAALAGVVFLSELISLRLVLSAALILGGIGLSILGRKKAIIN